MRRRGWPLRTSAVVETRPRAQPTTEHRMTHHAVDPSQAASVTIEEMPRAMAMNASVWQFGTISGPIAAGRRGKDSRSNNT